MLQGRIVRYATDRNEAVALSLKGMPNSRSRIGMSLEYIHQFHEESPHWGEVPGSGGA